MVVYTGAGRAPAPVYNERTLCGLGRSLGTTGRLDPDGVRVALEHLAQFSTLGRAMAVTHIHALATEAVRAASDGADFLAEAERTLGTKITMLDGEAEAAASAWGVVSGIPGADGMMGDLGGGSLEIVALDAGVPGARATLPVGSLRLKEMVGGNIAKAEPHVDKAIARVEWLDSIKGRTFYPVGGAWRAFANVHMGQHNYPLHVIHQYKLARGDAISLLQLIMRMSPKSLAKIPRVPKARLGTLPVAALVMERLLTTAKPKEIVFSAHGLREGWLYSQLPDGQKALDPLLAGAAEVAARKSRFSPPGEELEQWIAPLFPEDQPRRERLRRAAVMLSDVAWRDHPDYRARDSFSRVLHMPFTGIDHGERVILAFMVSASYGGGRTGPVRSLVRPFASDEDVEYAITVGRALRFARSLTGGTAEVLRTTRLEMDKQHLTLRLPWGTGYLMSDEIDKRFVALAKRLSRKTRVLD